ncbi:MAG: hypothetical protein V3T40_02285 [Nitrososphaerales archaeon]
MVRKTVKKKKKTKTNTKLAKKEKEIVVEKEVKKIDINTEMYRDLFKFLDEKVSVECFIDLHGQCYGKIDCECECHTKK